MIIGCVKEIKTYESRVALVPAHVRELCQIGSEVLIEKNAGLLSNITDEQYVEAGATISKNKEEIWKNAELIIKVKEPLEEEIAYFSPGLSIFTFFHLAAEPVLAKALLDKKICAIAYETIEENGHLPILQPMSEVAGRLSVQVGARFLESFFGGKGMLLGGVPGVKGARVLILGAGVVGKNAAKMALGLGADVIILDINKEKLQEIDDLFGGRVKTRFSNPSSIKEEVAKADLLIGAVLIPGAKAPSLVSRDMIKSMSKGSVVVDVSIDQGACIETMKRTTHDNPSYIVDGVVHYGVSNMPGAVPYTSTHALSHETFPYLLKMAKYGIIPALKMNPGLLKGLNTFNGYLCNEKVKDALGLSYCDPLSIL